MEEKAEHAQWPRWAPMLVLAAALAIRLTYLYSYHSSPEWAQLTVDNWYHHNWANSIANGNLLGDTTYFRAPFYVYCLGLLYAVLGTSLWVGRLFGLVVGLASVLVTFRIADRIAGTKAALIAAGLQALYPVAVYFESELLLDPLYMLLLQLSVYFILRWTDDLEARHLVVSALCLGLAIITRPVALALIPLYLAWVLWAGRGNPRRWINVIGYAGCLLLPILPISVRNILVADDPVLIASQGGINFFIGNNPEADGLSAVMPEPFGHNWQIAQITHRAEIDRNAKLRQGEVSAYWRDRALDWISNNPGDAALLYARKLGYQFRDSEVSNNRALRPHFASIGMLNYVPLGFGVVLGLAVIGAFSGGRENPKVKFLLLVILIHSLMIAFFFFSSRFRLPLVPYYAILAGVGVAWLFGRSSLTPKILLVSAGAVAGLVSILPVNSLKQDVSVQPIVSRGLYQYANDQLTQALASFEAAARIDPGFPEVNSNRGSCFLRLGDASGAEAAFREDIRLHPDRVRGYSNLAGLYLVTDEVTKALELAERAIQKAPYDLEANRVYLQASGADSNLSVERLAINIDRAINATHNEISIINEGAAQLVGRGALDLAIPILQRAEVTPPPPIETDDQAFGPRFSHGRAGMEYQRAWTYQLLSYCIGQIGNIEIAIEYAKSAIALDPNRVEAYFNLAAGYRATGRLVESDSVITEIKSRFPDHELTRRLLGS